MICLSAIDDLATTSEKKGAFVSGDGIFDESAIDLLCKPMGVSLKLFKNLESLHEDLSRLLSSAALRSWEGERKLAFQAVEANINKIESFVEKNLEVPLILGIADRINSLNRIEIEQLISVDTPAPWEIEAGGIIPISARLQIKIDANVQRQLLSPGGLPVLKVGVPYKPSFIGVTNQQQNEVLDRTAIVEVKAKRTGDGYAELEPTKVSLS